MSQQNQPNLTKTCINCGLHKPLSAFLEMSSSEGTVYGNICSTCRKTALEEMEKRKKADAEGSSTSESGKKIDGKMKVQTTADNRDLINRTNEEYHAERKLDEEINENKQQSDFKKEATQKKHHKDFLQKSSFLGTNTKPASKATAAQQQQANVAQGNEKSANQTVQRKEERIMKEFDTTVAHQGDQTGQSKFKAHANRPLMEFLARISSAPIGKNVNQVKAASENKQSGTVNRSVSPELRTDANKEKPSAKDPAVQFIEEKWQRPGGKR